MFSFYPIEARVAMAMHVSFEREALYQEVWETPLSHLCKKYGLSDNGLRKVCKALNIPLPRVGHWAKLAVGHAVTRTPLPDDCERSTFVSQPPASAPTFNRPDDGIWLAKCASFEEDPKHKIIVDPRPKRWHAAMTPLRDFCVDAVKAAETAKREAEVAEKRKRGRWEPNLDGWAWRMFIDRGQILNQTHKAAPLRVSLLGYERALVILNAICYAAETRGFEVSLNKEAGRIRLSGHEGNVDLRISERIEKAWRTERNPVDGKEQSVEYKEPTGKLRLFIGSWFNENEIADTTDELIEENLNSAFARIYAHVIRDRIRQREMEARSHEFREAEARRLLLEEQRREKEARREAEERMRQALIEETTRWKTASVIREYVAHLRAASAAKTADGFTGWCTWAEEVAHQIDPTSARLAMP